MNTNLLNIVKRIINEQGEGILGDAARLKSFVRDYAKDEPKEDRVAFGRAVEQGFYLELKRAAPHERARLKTALAARLQSLSGFDAARCAAAVSLLDALIAGAAAPEGSRGGGAKDAPAVRRTGKISRKTVIFGGAAGAGALAGELAANALRLEIFFESLIFEIALWAGVLSSGVSVALIAAQHILQRKRPDFKSLLPPALLGILTGAAAGGLAQAIFNVTQHISPFVKVTSNALCWGFFGAGLGFGVSLFIPNYPKKRAALAGLLGGTLGGIIYVALLSSGTNAGNYTGVIVLGLAIGLTISFIEEALREAWLTVIWGPKEQMSISLGAKPIVFGSSREADVFLPSRGGAAVPPVRALVTLENAQVILDDRVSGRSRVLSNGGEFTLDRLRVIVSTKA
jgi:hypothetical protein